MGQTCGKPSKDGKFDGRTESLRTVNFADFKEEQKLSRVGMWEESNNEKINRQLKALVSDFYLELSSRTTVETWHAFNRNSNGLEINLTGLDAQKSNKISSSLNILRELCHLSSVTSYDRGKIESMLLKADSSDHGDKLINKFIAKFQTAMNWYYHHYRKTLDAALPPTFPMALQDIISDYSIGPKRT